MTICEYCIKTLFTESYWKPKEKHHHTNIAIWEESIKHCTICVCLLNAAKDAVIKHVESEISNTLDGYTRFEPLLQTAVLAVLKDVLPVYSVTLQESVARDQFMLIFRPIEEKVAQIDFVTPFGRVSKLALPERRFQVYAMKPDDKKLEYMKTPRLSTETSIHHDKNPRNTRTLHQIQGWLEDCNSDRHSLCQAHTSSFVPTRLIAVGDEGENYVRLVETKDERDDYRKYATLSHCWGGFISVRTFLSNIDRFKRSIELNDEFPRNFRDAVLVCRALKIKYIWIDSLCIIQSSDKDWHHEAPRMHEVYGSSYLNIAATSARNSMEGLFRHRRINLLSPSTVPCGWQGRQRFCKVIREDFWDSELLAEPLYKRAWVSQERMLAPRTLNFGTRQLFWQCLTINACETMPSGIPPAVNSGGQQELQWRQLLAQTKNEGIFGTKDRIQLQDVWRDAVKNYSSCNITNTSDKLPALAGMAQVMHSICKENYVAGMWGHGQELVVQLAWKVKDSRNAEGKPSRRQRNDEYRAPSWAWPSVVDGVIEIPRRIDLKKDYELKLIEKPWLEYKVPEETFMELSGGIITAAGLVLDLEFMDTNDSETPCWIWNANLPDERRPWCYLYPDEPLEANNVHEHSSIMSASSNPASEPHSTRSNVTILLLVYSRELNCHYSGRGIAIRRSQKPLRFENGENKDTFKRIGLVEFRYLQEETFEVLMSSTESGSRVQDGEKEIVLV